MATRNATTLANRAAPASAALTGPARVRKAPNTRTRSLALAVSAALLPWGTAHGLPTGESVVHGDVSVARPNAQNMEITQGTQKAIVNWQSFSIGGSEHVNISQLNASSVLLNRVVGNDPSQIFGRLSANGQVFLVNTHGVFFSPSASVDVGSLFATSLSINDQDFLAGRYQFFNPGNAGSVVNQGNIITANGYTGLVGPQVRNDGVIVARTGSVALVAGDRVSLDMIGDGLISVSVDQAALNASVINTGRIEADGGTVLLAARSANALLDTVINNSGIIRANSLVDRNGEIVLDGGSAGVVSVTGTLQAAGTDTGTTGGTVKVLGQYVALENGARVDASGDARGGTVLIGGNYQGKGPEQNASKTFVGDDMSITADAKTDGDGGTVIVWSNEATKFYGNISARGGAERGDGGFVEVSGKDKLIFAGSVDTRAPNGHVGTLLLDPTSIDIVSGAAGSGDQDATLVAGTGSIAFADPDIGTNTLTVDQINTTGAANNIVLNAGGVTFNNSNGDDITLGDTFGFTINVDAATAGGGTNNVVNQGGNAFSINTSGAGGAITINAAGAVDLTSVALNTTGSGGISVAGTAGPVTLGAVTTSGTGNIAANSGNNLTLTAAVSSAGSTTLIGTGTVALGTNAVSGTSVTVTASGSTGDITSSPGGTITSTGAVSLTAGRNIQLQAAMTSVASTVTASFAQAAAGTFSTSAGVSGTTVNISSGTAGSTFDFSNAPAITATLTGSGATDTLIGRNAANAWNITGNDAGDVGGLTFSQVGTLTGGTSTDNFVFTGDFTVSSIAGGAGSDALNLSAYSTATDVSLTASVVDGYSGTATGITGFTGIDVLTGSAAAGSTLTGIAAGAPSWSTTGADAGTYVESGNTLTFSNFASWTGGGGIDTFNLGHNVTGTVDGGLGNDSFNYSAGTIGTLTGGGGTDTIVGPAGGATWNTTGADQGDVAGQAFSSIENWTGGGGADTFNLGHNVTGAVDGGLGNDSFNYSAGTIASVVGGGGTDTLVGSTSYTITGPDAGSAAGLTSFSGISNLTGTAGSDNFAINGGSISGTINALGGTDTLAGNTGYSITGTNSGSATGVGSFLNVENLTGTGGADTFTVAGGSIGVIDGLGGGDTLSGSTSYSVSAANAGSAAGVASFTSIETLTGTGGNDSFTLQAGVATFNGTINGAAGTDTLAATNGANNWVVTGVGSGTLNTTTSFTSIESFVGGTGADTLSGAAPGATVNMTDPTSLTVGTLNTGTGVVNLTAATLGGSGVVTAASGTFSSNTNVLGLGIAIGGNLHMSGSATLYNYLVGSSAGSFSVDNSSISVQINGVTFIASIGQQQVQAVIGQVAEQIGAVIVEEANKTFGTDSVAEDVEYGFAGEIGATPPMDHRIDESGISVPRCLQEAREGLPCK